VVGWWGLPLLATAGRINNLDAIRLFLAIAVIYSHSYPLAGGLSAYAWGEFIYLRSKGNYSAGHFAVNLFFVLSGYLISASWVRRKSVGDYFRRRVARIAPGYFVACTVTLAMVLVTEPVTTQAVLSLVKQAALGEPMSHALVYAQSPYPTYPNSSLWTIRYEPFCYLGLVVFAMLGAFRKRWFSPVLWIGCLLFYLSCTRLRRFSASLELLSQCFTVAEFSLCFIGGAIFYNSRERIPRSAMLVTVAVLVVAAAVISGRLTMIFAAVSTAGAYVCLWLAFHPRLNLRWVSKYGDLSYGTYLYAFPIQQLLQRYLVGQKPVLLFVASTPLALIAALLSWHLVEKRFLAVDRRGELARGKEVP
jgi:peptidoglycan/LPS O-acetylase OafA/YrhL